MKVTGTTGTGTTGTTGTGTTGTTGEMKPMLVRFFSLGASPTKSARPRAIKKLMQSSEKRGIASASRSA